MALHKVVNHIKWWVERRKHGFDFRDLWSLDHTMSSFILPRIKRFKDVSGGAPMGLTEESWDAIVDSMIVYFEWAGTDARYDRDQTKEETQGEADFYKYYHHLWF